LQGDFCTRIIVRRMYACRHPYGSYTCLLDCINYINEILNGTFLLIAEYSIFTIHTVYKNILRRCCFK
jgi:hypothetical protein